MAPMTLPQNLSQSPREYAAAFLTAGGVIPNLAERTARFRNSLRDGECSSSPPPARPLQSCAPPFLHPRPPR